MKLVNLFVSMLCLAVGGCIAENDGDGISNQAIATSPEAPRPVPQMDPRPPLIQDDGVRVRIGATSAMDGLLQVATSDPRLNAISASSSEAAGVYGNGITGVHGNGSNMGVFGYGGVHGVNGYGGVYGVFGYSGHFGVFGHGLGSGVHGEGGVYGVSAYSLGGDGVQAASFSGYAGRFSGGKGMLVEGPFRSQLEPLSDGEMVCGTLDRATGTYLLGRCDDRIKALEAQLAAIKAHLGIP